MITLIKLRKFSIILQATVLYSNLLSLNRIKNCETFLGQENLVFEIMPVTEIK